MKQIIHLHDKYDRLQFKYGDSSLSSIYGAGCINNPNIMFIFMNPTGRNISSKLSWEGIRAPWLGTKQVWGIFYDLGFLSKQVYQNIQKFRPEEWNYEFSNQVYTEIENNQLFITNLAKCTQIDSRPLNNNIFKEYRNLMLKEIEFVNPKKIITFGNQVSTILLKKNVKVSNYTNDEKEILNGYDIYPTYYPVGQGRRNMPLAVERIKRISVYNMKYDS